MFDVLPQSAPDSAKKNKNVAFESDDEEEEGGKEAEVLEVSKKSKRITLDSDDDDDDGEEVEVEAVSPPLKTPEADVEPLASADLQMQTQPPMSEPSFTPPTLPPPPRSKEASLSPNGSLLRSSSLATDKSAVSIDTVSSASVSSNPDIQVGATMVLKKYPAWGEYSGPVTR